MAVETLPAQCAACGGLHIPGETEFDHESIPLVCTACGADLMLFLPSYDGSRAYFCQECPHEHTWETEVFRAGSRIRVVTTCLHCGADPVTPARQGRPA